MKKDNKQTVIPDQPRPSLPEDVKKLNGKSAKKVKNSIEKLLQSVRGTKKDN